MNKLMHSETYWLKCATTPLDRAGHFGGDACVEKKRTITSDLTERLDAAVKEVVQSPERRFEKMTLEQELAVREFVGEEKGFKKGHIEGHKEGHKEGRKEGVLLGSVKILNDFVLDGTLTLETAAEKAGCTIEKFQEMMSKLENEQ